MTPKFTEEERAVLKKIYKIRRQIEKDMEGMTREERVAYINSGAPPREPRNGRSRKRPAAAGAK